MESRSSNSEAGSCSLAVPLGIVRQALVVLPRVVRCRTVWAANGGRLTEGSAAGSQVRPDFV